MRRRLVLVLFIVLGLVRCVGVPPEHKPSGAVTTGNPTSMNPIPLGIPDIAQDAAPTGGGGANDTAAPAADTTTKPADVCKPLLQDCK